jgi:hypothetical protein
LETVDLRWWQNQVPAAGTLILLDDPEPVIVSNVFEGRVPIHCAQEREFELRLIIKSIETWRANVFHSPILTHVTQALVDEPVDSAKDC